jgi:hypothetical protein
VLSEEKRKIQGFKDWLIHNEDFFALGIVAQIVPQKRVQAVIKDLKASGFTLDEDGVPIVNSDDEYRKLFITLYKSFSEATKADLAWGVFTPFLKDLRSWLIAVSGMTEEWWSAIDWKRVSKRTLGRIADNMLARGCPIVESGAPGNVLGPKDPEWYWQAVSDSILEALVEAASEY